MKSKISSLSKSEDFKNLLSGRKISNPYSIIFFKKIPSKKNKFLNVSFVTKKKIGNAVKRNKIKRRLRNIMNDAIKTINMNLNYSYLFIAKKNIYDAEYKMIKNSIFKDLSKVR
jgi:ribonuclease P protein component|tara:strand:- start:4605 stop:4946 length:342 start_codon:yes stop_codon:yes gene_type:complete